MIYNKLGNTDLDVSVICLGTMTFGEQNTEAEAHEQLDYAVANGVNFVDTAELYAVPSRPGNRGLTEQDIGSWITKGNRDKIILATKVTGPSPNLTYISENLGFSKARIHEAIDRSLMQLQTDYVDLYQLHWPERKVNFFGQRGFKYDANEKWDDNFQAIITTLDELKSAGKIRHWGLSNETPWGTMKYLSYVDAGSKPRPVSIQNPYSLLNRTYEIGMSELSIRENVGLLAYSPMAFGLLSGKYHKKTERPEARLHKYKSHMTRYASENCYNATAKYLEIAEKYELSLAQMSLAFINQQPFITSNIIGATSIKQLAENIASADVKLSKEILKEIDIVHEVIPNPAP